MRQVLAALGNRGIKMDRQEGRIVAVVSEEDAMAMGDSDDAKRWQKARADKAEIEVQQLRGEMLRKTDLEAAASQTFLHLRRGVEQLQRIHGNDAYEVMAKALRDAERTIFQTLTPPEETSSSSNGGSGPTT